MLIEHSKEVVRYLWVVILAVWVASAFCWSAVLNGVRLTVQLQILPRGIFDQQIIFKFRSRCSRSRHIPAAVASASVRSEGSKWALPEN